MKSVKTAKTVTVAAGVLIEGSRVLLSQRLAGTHLAGHWEFPGGKVEEGEDPRDTVARELKEEVGIDCVAREILDVTFHRYAEKSVLLLFFACDRLPSSPEPSAIHVAQVKWASRDELQERDFPPADLAILRKVSELLST